MEREGERREREKERKVFEAAFFRVYRRAKPPGLPAPPGLSFRYSPLPTTRKEGRGEEKGSKDEQKNGG